MNISNLATNLKVDVHALEKEIQRLLPEGDISDFDYADLAARTAASHNLDHYHYGTLGGKILATHIQQYAPASFSEAIEMMYAHTDAHGPSPLISKDTYDFVMRNRDELNATIHPERDLELTFFSLRTLMRAYLMKDATTKQFIETPQYMFLRVSCGISKGDVAQAIQVYHDMSQKYYVHATPTLFNAGTDRPQCSSCFLLTMKDDSLEGIFDTFKDISQISKHAGGIGLSVSNIRARVKFVERMAPAMA